ncbi:hypothetical protein TRFO_05793 [Tritrichomonas foetus]|uniref:RING-type domain-containing protein n=1 Tax=Tritrichomonas foetus TaxID=1144522 RepID=A0A1J4K7J9_9EUKA|nr:hypothetical protein TRFO_05793 [Tritrichomonas foetus]|eukprot:OHT05670.1 hypothetical protein TRFO_05793 [Tritrichomonas foetus]
MGGTFSLLPLQEPMWFSYYGPIRHAEASEALDAAITSHLQEIGSSSAIPIRKEVADQVIVPVALNTPPFTESDGVITVHYATSMPGRLSLLADLPIDVVDFDIGLDLTFSFPRTVEGQLSLQFDFDVNNGVSSRIYIINIPSDSLPSIVDDKVIVDGVTSSVSRVFHEDGDDEDGDTDFSDGLCLICCTNPATVIAFPCRHCCMCRSCSEKFATLSNHCPVCRAIVHELIECSTPEK